MLIKGIPEHIHEALIQYVNKENGAKFDLGCGDIQAEGFIGIDKIKSPYVDICLDLEKTPYKGIPANCASLLMASHVVEHIKPWLFVDVMNEWWRILKQGGQLMVATPYAGSIGFWQDPTHCAGFNELTFEYFDPNSPHTGNALHSVYKPFPWKLEKCTWDISGTLEVLLTKLPDDPSYHKLDLGDRFYSK